MFYILVYLYRQDKNVSIKYRKHLKPHSQGWYCSFRKSIRTFVVPLCPRYHCCDSFEPDIDFPRAIHQFITVLKWWFKQHWVLKIITSPHLHWVLLYIKYCTFVDCASLIIANAQNERLEEWFQWKPSHDCLNSCLPVSMFNQGLGFIITVQVTNRLCA